MGKMFGCAIKISLTQTSESTNVKVYKGYKNMFIRLELIKGYIRISSPGLYKCIMYMHGSSANVGLKISGGCY